MKVALITPTLIAHHAVPNSIINKYRALREKSHEVDIFVQSVDPEGLPDEIAKSTYVLTPEQLSKFSKGGKPFTENIEKWFDAQLYLFDYPHYYPFVDEIKRVEGITGFIYHGITPPAFADPRKRSLYESSMMFLSLLKNADFGIVYSKYTYDELVKKYRFSSKQIAQIPFGINIVKRKQPIENKYRGSKHILTYIGRITPHKNIEFLIRALPQIVAKKKDVFLYILGDDRGEYAREKARLVGIVKELELERYVEFPGLVDDLDRYIEASDVIVSASLHEGCWVPGLEAIAFKKPVVASDSTAIPFTVKKSGLYFDPSNQKEYIDKVLRVLDNDSVRSSLKKEAEKERVKISLEAHDKAFNKVISNALKMRPKRGTKNNKIDPNILLEKLRILEEMKDAKIDYHEFSDRKYIGSLLSKFRDFATRHVRKFYIQPLERAQINFNDAVVDEIRTILEYLAEKEKWSTKVGKVMQKDLNEEFYNRDYFIGGNKSNYGDYKDTKDILIHLADMVNEVLAPKSLLDIGCAYGYIPIRLREKGVAAHGIDISDFAISQANKPYLSVGDATNLSQFKNREFEVLVASEMMEHIPENKIDSAIKEAKRVASKYIVYLIAMKGFASHEGEHDHDISHVSVHNRKFWLDKFQRLGLDRDVDKERMLNTKQYSVDMGWSGRFFVLRTR
ncbi:MAG: glycosyl transferase family protein [uncultured bacterium]|uniref:Glycosyl transferase family protein n=4 Tax=Candidatus Daviesiibacteriota TaxID=1752718 RepID=A0A0G0ERS0_9BACT|nr:MAG: glycosyl transferase family protein [uncultured bacterium]KKQ08172.1 MAG: Glycosyl transferase family protein [Candidatus Daviesbacteria bacterium GW2011_GWB1_36_5]KKQ15634.1 MAG: Glycosyl transferase family protein [Candidatus Daviesbacteria bacterium GW2011_GWA1_36_8]OGE17504.1 MAG: hypothetical protein A2858_01195 [Candidatus Daviesbacteria bacterium RIFCSPHIGHO2_01_FULL_36_37]OGE36599.1 MAG: hypothetical protein A3E66_03040 [Candidatus Daviesbacteria bacterium RIFCSPHIGHO2_12_FULL_3